MSTRVIKYQAKDGSLHNSETDAQAADDGLRQIGPDDPGYRYKYWNITDVCFGLHGEATGSSEFCMSRDAQEDAVQWLQWRLDNWQPGHLSSVDEAVRALVVATLVEWRRWRERLDALSTPTPVMSFKGERIQGLDAPTVVFALPDEAQDCTDLTKTVLMTDAERKELETLRADDRARQLGDRPTAPAAKELRRLLDLERREALARERDEALKAVAIGYPANHGRKNPRP